MKKVFIILAVIFGLLVVSAAVLPIIFKDKIVEVVKKSANDSLEAKVDFGDFDLSLLTSFPNFKFSIDQVSVVGIDNFDGDTLVYMGNLNFKLNLKSVLSGDYTVNSFEINDMVANAIYAENGTANWEIVPDDEAVVEEEELVEEIEEEDFKFNLSSYKINNATIVYDDRMEQMKAVIEGLNHEGSFSMDGELMFLSTNTSVNALSYIMEGITLINKSKLTAQADLDLDMENEKFTFKKNKFTLNNLNLGIDGWMAFVGEDMDFDLKIEALDNRFEHLLSMVPGAYQSDIEGLQAKGDFGLSVNVKGLMTETDLPGYHLDFSIKDAAIQYPDLPKSVNNIQMELNVDFPGGSSMDKKVIDLSLFHLEIGKNPIDINYHVTNIETDPIMKGAVKSKLNLKELSEAIPMEGEDKLEGRINADLIFAGRLSHIENEQYDLFKANGEVSILDFLYQTPDMPDTKVSSAYFSFSPQAFKLTEFDAMLGLSDLKAKGAIDNIFGYAFNDEVIHGEFLIESDYFYADEWMEEDSTEVGSESSEEEEEGIIEVPKNINFTLKSNFKKIDYDNMPISNFTGDLIIKEGAIIFQNNYFELLGSKMNLAGEYSTKDITKPMASMNLKIKNLDIPTAFNTFNTIKSLLPLAENAKGSMDMNISFSTILDQEMSPVFNTLNGKGNIYTKTLMIEGSPFMESLAEKVKNPKLKKARAEDIKIVFKIIDGKVNVDPFDLKLGSSKAVVSGWNSFDQTMEYTMELLVPRKDLGSGADAFIGSLEQKANQFGTNFTIGENLLFDVIVSGNTSNPNYKVVPRGTDGEKSIKNQAKDELNKQIDDAKKKAKEELNKAKEEIKEEVDKKVDEAKDKAEQEIERKKEEAKKKLEAEKKRLEEEKKKEEEKLKQKGKDALKKGLGF